MAYIFRMPRYKPLSPVFDKSNLMWRLIIPASISQTGQRQRKWYASRQQAEAAVKQFQHHRKEFGASGGGKLLEASRLLEATDCWKLLDESGSTPASPGEMRKIILHEVKARQERDKSISLDACFDDYLAKLQRQNRSANYFKQYKWCRSYFHWISDKKVSDLTVQDIRMAFFKLPDGNFNSNLSLIKAILNHSVKLGYAKSNVALQIERRTRPHIEVEVLPNDVVEAMLTNADLELLPFLTLGFYCGIRHAELLKIQWQDVLIQDAKVYIRATVSKTRKKRFPPLPQNAVAWLNLCNPQPAPTDFIVPLTVNQLRLLRCKNYEIATGTKGAIFPKNALRRTFASNHIAAFEDYDKTSLILGHTSHEMSAQYMQGIPKASALAYFQIFPNSGTVLIRNSS
jgi:integrase